MMYKFPKKYLNDETLIPNSANRCTRAFSCKLGGFFLVFSGFLPKIL